ncbi:hypothetical protein [Clostridium beijerinckii]|uniref:hypothetical protein n=1 Tax=Clostridium beijerinckii TaxID=1520 RepID=UPI001494284E|nr:hypothetical protein [Clostridium beijerinckii]NOW03251.1 hypothetical protein [Clostridium beijerinckii]NYC03607.1 hypothetical protein [Clostridium beijerinckii]
MERKDFKNNLINAILEIGINEFTNIKFKIIPVFEEGKRYNSDDDYMKLGALDRANLNEKYFDLDGVINLLSAPKSRFPLWITVELVSQNNDEYFIELKTSFRFRTSSILQNQDTGHPPFKVIK